MTVIITQQCWILNHDWSPESFICRKAVFTAFLRNCRGFIEYCPFHTLLYVYGQTASVSESVCCCWVSWMVLKPRLLLWQQACRIWTDTSVDKWENVFSCYVWTAPQSIPPLVLPSPTAASRGGLPEKFPRLLRNGWMEFLKQLFSLSFTLFPFFWL